MKLLGIDYGTKKVGLALSDDTGSMAFPHGVVKNDASFFTDLCTLIKERGVSTVVVGHSLNKDGEANAVQEAINELITDLTLHVGVPVHLEPEQYSTQEAMRLQGRTEQTDAAAAAIILNSFITRTKS